MVFSPTAVLIGVLIVKIVCRRIGPTQARWRKIGSARKIVEDLPKSQISSLHFCIAEIFLWKNKWFFHFLQFTHAI